MPERPTDPTLAGTIAAALAKRGVKRLFGMPGGGSSLDLIAAADAAGIDFVLARSETAAAIMAAVTGELTGSPGVVLTGVGPGAASAVNGIAYASLERAPVVLFADGPASSLHQAFDQQALYAPISKWQGRLRPDKGTADIERALATACGLPRGPVFCELTAGDAAALAQDHGPDGPAAPDPVDDGAALAAARRLLSASRRPIVLAGLEARDGDAPAALNRLAESLGCPVLTTYKAKGVLPERHALSCGLVTGAAGEGAGLEAADLIVLFGLDPIELIPGPWRPRAPVLELRATAVPDFAVTPAARLVGPLATTAANLLPIETAAAWQAGDIAALRHDLLALVSLAGSGHTAASVTETLRAAAPPGCRLTVDAGAHMFSTLALWPAEEPFGVLKSNGLSTMGFALPAAIASALEQPTRPVLAVTGDGGMMMSLAELATAVEHRLGIVVLVMNDAALSLIAIKQQRQQRPSRGVATPSVDFAALARTLGCRAWRVEAQDDLAAILVEAFQGEGPAVIDVTVDPSGYGDQLERLRG